MAYLSTNNKILGEGDQAAQTGQPQAAPTGGPQSVSGAASDVVGAGNATGATTPGQGAWTNIQAYMNANAGDTGTADALDKKVGTQFDKERTAFTNDANKVKAEAQSQSNAITDAQKNAQAWTQQAGAAYNYAGDQNDAYNQNKTQLQSALNSKYAGPTSYTYGFGADTQAAGAALNDNNTFNQYLGNLYQEQAGGQLSSGGRALQTQLDVNNNALVGKRQELADRFKTLTGERDKTVTDTTTALGQAQSDYAKNQNALKDGLINSASSLDTNIAKQEADARAAYQTDFTTSKSGINNPGVAVNMSDGGKNFDWWNSPNMTWNQVAEMDKFGRSTPIAWENVAPNNLPVWEQFRNNVKSNQNALTNYYNTQDTKYGNTADAEERQWNFIQDVLGNTDRKAEGFKVRG